MNRSASFPSMVLAGLLVLAAAQATPTVAADGATAFERIGTHYETIRQALLHDTGEGVPAAAGQIGKELEALDGEPTAARAGTRAGTESELTDLLPDIEAAAAELEQAGDLEQARAAFGELSKAMVRYRRMVADPEPVVVFCSMAQEVWLQPKGEIGNPYYGQSMARCGEVVSE